MPSFRLDDGKHAKSAPEHAARVWGGANVAAPRKEVQTSILIHSGNQRIISPPTVFVMHFCTRALHDSLMVIKRMLESNVLVAGGGSVETALSIYLESFATTLGSREQLAIAEFAEALLVIPKTLAVNAAQVIFWGESCSCPEPCTNSFRVCFPLSTGVRITMVCFDVFAYTHNVHFRVYFPH